MLVAFLTILAGIQTSAATPVVSSSGTATGTVGSAFSYQITASNTPTSFDAVALPGGLSVNTTSGLINGTPTSAATTNVTVKATNASGTGTKSLSLTVDKGTQAAVTITSAATTTYGSTYTATATGGTGTGVIVWSLGTGSTAAGAAIDSPTGAVTFTGTGTVKFKSYRAADSNYNQSATTSDFTLTINPPVPVITGSASPAGKVGASFSYQITASNSPTSYGATGLPPGLSVNTSTGVISGTPTNPGVTSVTISATNAGGTTTATITISILATLPYSTDFETGQGYTIASLSGQLGWAVTQGGASVTSADHANGTQSVELAISSPPALVTQGFADSVGETIEFFDIFAKPVAETDLSAATTFTVEGATFAFKLNGSQGILQTLNGNGSGGGVWNPTGFAVAVGTNHQTQAWVRLSARLDFTNHTWDLYANGTMVAADIPVTASSTYLSTFRVQGNVTTLSGIDYIYAGPTNPIFTDTNNNGIDDTWETAHGLSLSNSNRNSSPAGNGVTVIQAYVSGTNPNDFYNGVTPTLSIIGGNNQLATVGQFNAQPFDVGVWNASGTAPMVNAPVSFSVLSGGGLLAVATAGNPALSSTLNLVTDANGTAQVYYQQPSSPLVQSTIRLTAGSAQANFASLSTSVGDSDGDGLLDAWETACLGILSYGAGDDPGDVGRTLLASYQQSLSPWPAPTVSSGLKAWYRADLGVTKDANNNVTQWADVSGSGAIMSPAVLNNAPTVVSQALNGHPAMSFNGDWDYFATLNEVDLLAGSNDLSFVVVMKPSATSANGGRLMDVSQASLQMGQGEGNRYYAKWQDTLGDYHTAGATAATSGVGQVYTMVLPSGGYAKGYLNGQLTDINGSTGSGLTQSPKIFSLGALNGAPYGFAGEIAEVLIYNRALTDQERTQIEAALLAKYVGSDADGDGLPDSWEMEHLGSLSYDAGDDPGGVGRTLLSSYQQSLSPWPAPTVSNGLKAWYRADLGTIKDSNNNVTQWADISSHGQLLVPGALESSPVAVSQSINGHPAVSFSGYWSYFSTTVIKDLLAGSNDLSAIVVMKPAEQVWSNSIFLELTQASLQLNRHVEYGTYAKWLDTSDYYHTGAEANTTLGVGKIYTVVLQSGGDVKGYLNGQLTDIGGANGSGLTQTLAGFNLGAGVSGQDGFSGEIAEVLIYNRAISDTERQQIESVLVTKYIGGSGGGIDPTDSDNNGLADAWETQYFGQLGVDPNGDPDGDGITNLTEFLTGRNPTKTELPETTGVINLRVYSLKN